MGQMKQLAIAIDEAIEQGLMPDPDAPRMVWVLTCDGDVLAVYADEDSARFDRDMCIEADEWEAGEPHTYVVTGKPVTTLKGFL